MNIIIIEDEIKTADSLQRMITDLKPDANIIGRYQSIEGSVKALSEGPTPDLVFMDIQLADGLCFEIFKLVKVSCPVIFCTAFDEYSFEAFKNNGVDYVLKPFSRDDIRAALKKIDNLENFFQRKTAPDWAELISKLAPPPSGKTSFLIFKDQKYKTINVEDIAFFYVKYEATWIMCFDKHQYNLDQSLEQVANSVSAKQFFRVNRQYLVNFKAIKEVEPYFLRKLYIKLVVETPDKLLVNKEKSQSFLSWMEDR